jgi:23S rRNA (adenine1618-N6)-methyltransferase
MEKAPKIEKKLHPRNKHQSNYDLEKLAHTLPELAPFIITTEYGKKSINFFNSEAVKLLNQALLKLHYDIKSWTLPKDYLCPPIPGRADYIHYLADLLAGSNSGKIPKGKKVKCLDIGTGSSLIYPIIGNAEYGWTFAASEIDETSANSAEKIISDNEKLSASVQLRRQNNPRNVFAGVFQHTEQFDITMCNPPFHISEAEANAGTKRKLKNLKRKKVDRIELNFGGQNNELWCPGGEKQFIRTMIQQSKSLEKSCLWFTTLVSKKTSLHSIYKGLEKVNCAQVKTVEMTQGNKTSRFVAWTFKNEEEQKVWAKKAHW